MKSGGTLKNLMRKSPAVARQFRPCGKPDSAGDEVTFQGIHKTGIPCLERMYGDRVAVKLTNKCPAYCVFCFRRWTNAKLPEPAQKDLKRAAAYIKKDKRITGVLITGGEPLREPEKLEYLIGLLGKIPHVTDIRVGTRAPLTAPKLVTAKLIALLKKHGIEVGIHFNHPDELVPAAQAIKKMTGAGIRVYSQSVLLKGINDSGPVLEELFRGLRSLGVEIYALYHCDPVKGAMPLRTTIEKGLEIKKYLRAHSTGRINPAYIVDTRVGKVEIGVDGTIEKRQGRFVWIRTPYQYPKSLLPGGICRVNRDGTVSVKYRDGEK
ncbi:radical SAM protein [Candidatus Peregrinibacteria bacterium]|nr:radical SAM protein [Candidatus Peregrinibacteria bacterium]